MNNMKKVFIKYNPYQVTTKILIDGKEVKKNSRLNVPDQRLQEWVDNLPDILYEECSTKQFEISFQGTVLDYEDILAVAQEALKKRLDIKVEHIPAKEVKDKEQAIAKIFEEIQQGPFDELKQPDVIRAFEMAKSSDFEVNVVATMSAGKSTLINSFLGQKLMPAKQEACTATITEIKDNDSDHFEAQVYDKSNTLIESQSELSYAIMDRLNSNPEVSRIHVEGNIPFVTSDDVSLVLVDTPGPNNSRDPEHKAATYRMLSESSKTVVLYIMNATQLAVDDDSNLLAHVAESMKVGGKQSRDRFIFVVNKLDDFKKGEDSIDAALKKVKDYLADNGIENPNIYPASALTALNIRTVLAQSDDDDDDEVYEAKGKVRKFNRNEEMFFENYAPLPASAKGIIAKRLEKAIEENDTKEQALIHSGIVPVEEAIKMYVLKYAKTAKIKNIVDTFIKKLETAKSFEETIKDIASAQKDKDKIVARIDSIETKLQSGEEAKKFKKEVNDINYDKEISKRINSIIKKMQEKITSQFQNIPSTQRRQLSRDMAESICAQYAKDAETLQAEVQVALEGLIENNIKKNAEDLLKQYKKRLSDLADEINVGDVVLDPFEIMKGEIPSNTTAIISGSTKTEIVKTGEEWIKNHNKKWYKPWTWTQESGHYRDINETREYIDRIKLADKFFAPLQEQIFENCSAAEKYAKEETKRIKIEFGKKFDELDELLRKKLDELKECAMDEEVAKKKLEKAQKRLEWLNSIQERVSAILEI